jgi:outer membrane protein assembly factor BamD
MRFWCKRLILAGLCCFVLPFSSPAPLIYRAGEGWTYESVGGGKWERARAKDQLEVAQSALDKQEYNLALKAARRVVRRWPLSDYAPQAQYILGRSYEAKNQDQRAFKEYQKLLEKYPKVENYQEVLQRQFAIANRFLGGQWFKLWGYIPFFPSMEKTAEMYTKLIKNGPYSEVAPKAQMNIGSAREKQLNYPQAVKAYEHAADVYHDQPAVAADALYKAGMAYYKQAKKAEYDQGLAQQAVEKFTDFLALYPTDPRVPEAQRLISSVYAEQARGSFRIAEFYEKKKRWAGALTYYNEVNDIYSRLIQKPDAPEALQARRRIEALKKRTAVQTAQK